MKTLISMPLAADVLAEYPPERDLAASCREYGCDGLEVVWGGEDLPKNIPQALHLGYHLTFYPDWLDFWNADQEALLRKFGSQAAWEEFYGGPAGQETLLRRYREDLDRALGWGAEYLVFHVSDVSLEEGYTYAWEHDHQAVLAAAAQAINLLLEGQGGSFAFLVENQWWPGFTFTNPTQTAWLLDAIRYPNKGIMLDTGHLMNANLDLKTQAEGAAYIHQMLDDHGDLCRSIRGIHLHQSLSGAYVKGVAGQVPADLTGDYISKFCKSYGHILQIDTHRPWTDPAISSVIRRIGPEYLVHELSAGNRAIREERLRTQVSTLHPEFHSWQIPKGF
ncbi:MAG: TIM barrel protein [Pseudoflavonifractor sp.]